MKRSRETEYRGFYEALQEDVLSYRGEFDRAIVLAPEFFRLMTNLLEDSRTTRECKVLINAAIAYFVAPFDVIPEAVYGPYGYVDDLFLCCYVAKKLTGMVSPEMLEQNWEGEMPLTEVVEEVYTDTVRAIEGRERQILEYVGLE